jgi:hypothetical protein
MSHLLRLGNGGKPKGRWSIERENDSSSFGAGRRSNKTLRREDKQRLGGPETIRRRIITRKEG